jgi:hypothetical protein
VNVIANLERVESDVEGGNGGGVFRRVFLREFVGFAARG